MAISVFAPSAQAAELRFGTSSLAVENGDMFSVPVIIDTQGESVNAAEGVLVFPAALLDLQGVETGGSLLNFWVVAPHREGSNRVVWSGVAPGGFMGVLSPYWEGYVPGPLFHARFRAKAAGNASFSFENVRVLLNDGAGTPAVVTLATLPLRVVSAMAPAGTPVPAATSSDQIPPEPFSPVIARDPNLFEGRWFVAFVAEDKQSGIDHYEAFESRSPREYISPREWMRTESPYLLKDQALKSYIYVKAVDNAGNVRVAVISPHYPLRWYERQWFWSILLAFLLSAFGLWVTKRRKTP